MQIIGVLVNNVKKIKHLSFIFNSYVQIASDEYFYLPDS